MIKSQATPLAKSAVLSLDLGTYTGWAIHRADLTSSGSSFIQTINNITSGTESFKLRRSEQDGVRYLQFARWLGRMLNPANKIGVVFFEMVYDHSGTYAAHVYGGFMGILTALCERYKIPYVGVAVGTIKRFITGKGDASKAEVIRSVKMRGHVPRDHNEADALALLYLAMERVNESSTQA